MISNNVHYLNTSQSKSFWVKAWKAVLPLFACLCITHTEPIKAQSLPSNQMLGSARNASSDSYVVNQTFDGQSYFKDNNIWVVTSEFAKTFGMPPEMVDVDLKGVEAVAFRIEDSSNKLCGLGGKAENCKRNDRCMLDIYVDERKHPLPWATDQKADWHWRYNSSVALRTPTEKDGVPPARTATFIPNPILAAGSTLHPFVDPMTAKEAIFLENSRVDGDDDLTFNTVNIFGFKRQAIAGLTLVSLSRGCLPPNPSKRQITFRLETREKLLSPAAHKLHEFVVPASFTKRLRETLQAQGEVDAQYFRSLILNRESRPK